MIEVCRVIGTPPERIFAVLADGWSYASWVVGAAHVRAVDHGWPAVGARVLPEAVLALMLRPRNSETLHRVEDIAVHRQPPAP